MPLEPFPAIPSLESDKKAAQKLSHFDDYHGPDNDEYITFLEAFCIARTHKSADPGTLELHIQGVALRLALHCKQLPKTASKRCRVKRSTDLNLNIPF